MASSCGEGGASMAVLLPNAEGGRERRVESAALRAAVVRGAVAVVVVVVVAVVVVGCVGSGVGVQDRGLFGGINEVEGVGDVTGGEKTGGGERGVADPGGDCTSRSNVSLFLMGIEEVCSVCVCVCVCVCV